MKNILIFVVLLFSLNLLAQDEISLFNSEGEAIAYIDTDDDDLTIYLWGGNPVAYLHKQSGQFHVYGFNGNHLGWLIDGIIINHEGYAVGVTKDATSMYTQYESYKGYKKYKPYKSYKEYAPYKPYSSGSWSSNNFKLFLLLGLDD
tara:strand:+ start:297 stop:734 length:438 start_codon:yes stop_codon:yes gene_type:complete